MRVLTVVGARPQFVKAALLSREFAARGINECLVHTGQHYDAGMSEVFFSELRIPQPRYNLGVGSASHGAQTAQMMSKLEPVMQYEQPDVVIVYGDTNSTLAGALVASKLNLPVAHVEAGLRSFDRTMPEEINRLLADRISALLLVPTRSAAEQLAREGILDGVTVVGDLMVDLALITAKALDRDPPILHRFSVRSRDFALATIHRAANTDDVAIFARLIAGLRRTGMRVIFPVHPRTQRLVELLCVGASDNIVTCEPLSYREMLALQAHARVVITDSGGMQKEAITLGTPCVTLRDRTEWNETLEGGWNVLAGSDPCAIALAARREPPRERVAPFGAGGSAARIVDALVSSIAIQKHAGSCAS
ncbi:MAG TPA: UDP-N-acetylglucosamine 2-epimerase (non-hydrolyzing) [Candidatus Baltobacteraceae bacterium]|nr:UDP-N-acetylglucosamine 2-epimerase (non-hydrolyzing) [Candidatus Baltobacteraceae bacterium]